MNLVFNKWNDIKPIPNLSELPTIQFVSFPFFMMEGDSSDKMGMENVNIKRCKLDDIHKDDNFYFIASYRFSYNFYIKNADIFLPNEIEFHISNNNLKVIFLSETESMIDLPIFVELLVKKIKRNKWNEENFYIIDNNSNHLSIKERFKTNINFFKINYLIHMTGKLPNKISVDNLLLNKKFIFLCHNREPHDHRILLLTYLKYNNLLDKDIVNWSMIIKQNIENGGLNSFKPLKNYIDTNNKQLILEYSEIRNTKKLCYYEEGLNILHERNDYDNDVIVGHVTEDSFQNAYINIVTETHFFKSNRVHITEKSFKPFYFFQLPIFLSTYNHVKMMREEYDFYFFDDLIDHSYDDEIDDVKRFHMVLNEIKRLSTMRDEISNYYKNNLDKLLHNHNFIKNNNYAKIFKQYIINL